MPYLGCRSGKWCNGRLASSTSIVRTVDTHTAARKLLPSAARPLHHTAAAPTRQACTCRNPCHESSAIRHPVWATGCERIRIDTPASALQILGGLAPLNRSFDIAILSNTIIDLIPLHSCRVVSATEHPSSQFPNLTIPPTFILLAL